VNRSLFGLIAAQRRFVYLAIAVLSGAGIWAAVQLPSAIYPELTFNRITIVVQGSSLGARQVLFSITRPIEEAISIVPGVERVQSRSIRGGSETNINFAPKTDMMFALQQVQARVNQVRGDLPAGVEVEVERMTPSLFPVLTYNLENGDPATLYDIARYQIKPLISRVPGVGRVDVQASDVREIEVIADPARLASQGMTYEDLAAAIQGSSSVAAVGRMPQDYKQYLIVTTTEAHSIDDIASIVVGHGLRVGDLARVTSGTEDHVRIVAGDGKPAALINITRQIGGNTVAIADSVARIADALRKTLPSGVVLKPVYDQAALVRDATKSVRDAMIIGAVLAVIVLLLFLRHGRVTAISASSIPITMAITVFVMSLIGQTFNLMTLGAMAIAIGLVIDDAVVITENIVRHVRLAAARRTTGSADSGAVTPATTRTRAIREAVHELIWPVTTSTLTTVVVFLPLGLLQGVVGQFFKALSITLAIAVLVSLILALSIIPLLAEQFLHVSDTEPGAAAGSERAHGPLPRFRRGIDGLADRYERSLGATLHDPRLMLGAALLLVVLGVVVDRFVGTGFLPEMDEGAFVLDYFTPGGTSLAESNRQLTVAERILAREPEVAGTSRRLGAELGLFATEQNSGDIVVRLKPRSERERSSVEVIDDVRAKINSAAPRLHIEFVQILSDVINDLAGAASPVEIKLFGERLDDLESYARSLEPKLQEVDGLEDLYNGVSEPSPEMTLRVNEAETSRIGLAPQQVGAAVSGALLGVQAGQVRLEDRAINVRVRAPDSVRYDPTSLASLPVVNAATGVPAPLSSVASITPAESRAELLRENQQQMIDMTAEVSGRSLGSVMRDVKSILAANRPPSGIRVEVAGQYANQQESFRALLLVLALASVSVIAIMVIQFRSFIEPLVIVLAAPLSFVGAVTLLWITGTQLNVSSLMGLILLVGLIVKNGIILLDFTQIRMRDDGDPLEVAIRHAARVRLRPILMTTLCTLFGLIPLALGLGAGSELQRPLALAVIGGLALSTPITLYVVPTFIVAIRGRGFTLDKRASSRSSNQQAQVVTY
jgi:CzcA family heavy metal efflux pump